MGNALTRGAEEKSQDEVEERSQKTKDDTWTGIGYRTVEDYQSTMEGDGWVLVQWENYGIATFFVNLIVVVI